MVAKISSITYLLFSLLFFCQVSFSDELRINALRYDITSQDIDKRQSAADELEKMGDAGIPILINAMKNEKITELFKLQIDESEFPWEISNALAKIGSHALPELLKGLTNNNPAVRAQAITAIGNMAPAGEEGLSSIAILIHDQDKWVRISAINAVGKYKKKSLQYITDICAIAKNSQDTTDKLWAISSLEVIGIDNQDIHECLKNLLNSSDKTVKDKVKEIIR